MKGWEVEPVEGVAITYRWGGFVAVAAWPTRGRHGEIMTVIRVEYQGAEGAQLVRSETRINLHSSSAVDGLATALRRVTEDKADKEAATRFVLELADDVIGWYRRGARTTNPQPALSNGNGWLVYPVWPAVGATAVSGGPGTFKSYVALGLALQLTTGVEVLANNTREPRETRPVLFVDWEADEATFASRLYALCAGAGLPPSPYLAYKQMRVPLADAAVMLQEEIARGGYGAVVLDSMSAGAGGSLLDDVVVNGYFDAVRLLGVPALVLLHKSAENIKAKRARAFGSIMHEVRVRMAWNVEKARDGDAVVWQVFKDNNTGRVGNKLAWRVALTQEGDDQDRHVTVAHIDGIKPTDATVPAQDGDTIRDRVILALTSGALMVGEIAAVAGTSDASVRKVLSRHAVDFDKLPDGRWSLAGSPARVHLPDPL